LLDFWATWCPPCQRPMAHNQEMLEKNGDAWKEKKIRIIGLSIDQTAEAVVKHVNDKKWNAVEHFHRSKSKCSDTYSVRGVPCVMLIDQNGKIVFKGHPASRPDLEKDLNDLAEGKELSVDGAEEESADAGAEAKVTVDGEKMNQEIESFKTQQPELYKELKDDVSNFMRAFCVMVGSEKLNPATGKFTVDYKNYRVLVGPKEPLEKVKAVLNEKVKGSFEIVLREQALN